MPFRANFSRVRNNRAQPYISFDRAPNPLPTFRFPAQRGIALHFINNSEIEYFIKLETRTFSREFPRVEFQSLFRGKIPVTLFRDIELSRSPGDSCDASGKS